MSVESKDREDRRSEDSNQLGNPAIAATPIEGLPAGESQAGGEVRTVSAASSQRHAAQPGELEAQAQGRLAPWQKRLIALGVTAVVVGLLFLIPAVREGFGFLVTTLSQLDIKAIAEYLRGFGVLAAVISMALMVFQSLVAPIPSFLLTFANAVVFGWALGALISWAGAMLGAMLCFAIARFYGREAVAKLTGKGALHAVDEFFARHGNKAVLFARLIPFLSFDLVSYAAGLTAMRLLPFLVATGLGQLPMTIVYSYAGEQLTGDTQAIVTGIMIMLAVGVLVLLLRAWYKEKKRRKAAAEQAA